MSGPLRLATRKSASAAPASTSWRSFCRIRKRSSASLRVALSSRVCSTSRRRLVSLVQVSAIVPIAMARVSGSSSFH
ncbi:MAG: hypothetical protein ABS89_09215 [Thiobacillus sp. SCN 63-1177]|nr:MAG: hypothetical protein ABS89_09215 [Thiobacillus sp. SCN 63-1177]